MVARRKGMNSFKIGTSAEDAQNKVDSQAPPPPPDLELIPDEVQKPAADWTAFRVGVRYDPPLLALEWKGDGKTLRKDIPFPRGHGIGGFGGGGRRRRVRRRRVGPHGEDARRNNGWILRVLLEEAGLTAGGHGLARGAGLRGDVVGGGVRPRFPRRGDGPCRPTSLILFLVAVDRRGARRGTCAVAATSRFATR